MQDDKPIPNCINCAWREVCQKRYGQAADYARHCVDYSWDVRLRKREDKQEDAPASEPKPGS